MKDEKIFPSGQIQSLKSSISDQQRNTQSPFHRLCNDQQAKGGPTFQPVPILLPSLQQLM